MKKLIWLLMVGIPLLAPAEDKLFNYSLLSTNWESKTNYVECHLGFGTNGGAFISFPRDTYLLGTISSNTFDAVLHNGKTISTTLEESNVIAQIKVTWHTNVFTKTNITTFK